MENGERREGESGAPAVDRGDDAGGRSSGAAVAAMRWESFLPRRSLRVLLVEGDDSTRHIVTALLRKCNYRVSGVADGMKAWEVMKEKSYWFDLVLTEVATTSLSGIGLLTKIMGAEECKNIPVIMMSTHDSVNVVLKCMLKGAVDFLVKPVRKNELRNLWQHVWRRHCMNASDNNNGSNQISANVGGRSKTGGNSDERSDTQSSGSKREIEIESTQKHEEPPQVEDRRTSEGEANLDSFDKDAAIRTSVSQMDYGENTKDDNLVGIRVDITLPLQEALVHNVSQERNRSYNISACGEETLDLVRPAEVNNDDPKSYCQNSPPNESEQNMIIFVEPISNGQCSYAVLKKDARVEDELCEAAKSSYVSEASNIVTSPLWELSLRRTQPNGCVQPDLKEQHVLKHSVTSAFSRYGEKRIRSSFKTGSSDVCIRTRKCDENCHSLVNSRGTGNEKNTPFCHIEKSLVSPRGNEDETTVYFQVSSTNKENAIMPSLPTECAGHSSAVADTALHCPQFGLIPLPMPVGAIRPIPYQSLCARFGGIVQPVFYPETSLAPQGSAAIEKPSTQIPSSDHSVHHNNNLINNSSLLGFHHREETDHPRHWRQAINILEPGDFRELCNHMEQAYRSGSCNQDVLKSSGSNGSDETPDGARNTNALESGNESGVQNCNRNALDWDCSRREAALIKFRMKRKDRCFEKKVMYYSRKKLAEQRPRIKGQFVRQKILECMTTAGDS